MFRQIGRMRPHWLVLILMLIVLVCMYNAASAITKDDLSLDDRQRFDELREELREANVLVEDAKQRAYSEDPLLLKAKEGVDQSRELTREAGKEDSQVKQFLSGKGKEERRTYKRWLNYSGEVQDYEAFKTMMQDKKLKPLLSFFANRTLEELRQRKSSNALDLIRGELPSNDEKISSQRALRLYLLLLQLNANEATKKLADLEKQISPPAFMSQYAKEQAYANGLFVVCDTYFRLKMPEYVAETKKECRARSNKLRPQLDQIWPGWEKAEMREYELQKATGALEEPARPAGTLWRSLLVIVGAGMIVILGAIVYTRSRNKGIFIAVALRLRNTNTQPEKGSSRSTSLHIRAKPSIPRRKSAGSMATIIRICGVI